MAQNGSRPAMVGEHGRHSRLIFEGQRHFSQEQLVDGLRFNVEFLIASESSRPMSEFRAKLERLIELGYRANGFAEARIKSNWDEVQSAVVTRIEEGARFVSGDVRVEGGVTVDKQHLRSLLLPSDSPAEGHSSRKSKNKSGDPVWRPDVEVDFTRSGELAHLDTIKEALFQAGYPFAKFNRKLLPQPDGTCTMLVAIEDEGPQARIGEIKITGADKNSQEAILNHLGLEAGQPYNAQVETLVERRLIEEGRFIDSSLEASPPDERGDVHLAIGVRELDEAPPLGQELSEVQQLLLKCQRWLESPEREHFDLEFNIREELEAHQLTARLVLSASGLLLEAEAPGLFHRTVVMLNRSNFTLAIPATGSRIELPTSTGLTGFLHFSAAEDWNSDQRFSMQLGGGVSSLTNSSVVAVSLRVLPAMLLSLAGDLTVEPSEDAHNTWLKGPKQSFEIEHMTGRVIQATITTDDRIINITSQRDRFIGLRAEWSREILSLSNHVSSVRPVSTTIAGLARLALFQPVVQGALLSRADSRDSFERKLKALQLLEWEKVLLPLDTLDLRVERDFIVPADIEAGGNSQTSTMELFGGYLAGLGPELFPADSVLSLGLRFVGLSLAGRPMDGGRYLMTEWERRPPTGPAAIWAMAKMLHLFGADAIARSGAEAGYRLLSPASFQGELSSLLEDRSVASQFLHQLGHAIADASEADLAEMVDALDPPWSDFIRETATIIRQHPDQPLAGVWLPVWDRLWRNGLEELLEEDLYRMRAPSGTK